MRQEDPPALLHGRQAEAERQSGTGQAGSGTEEFLKPEQCANRKHESHHADNGAT